MPGSPAGLPSATLWIQSAGSPGPGPGCARPPNKSAAGAEVLLGYFGIKIDGDSWFTWWFHDAGPSISPQRTPMCRRARNDL